MRVHLIRRESIEEFVEQYPQSRAAFRGWLDKIRFANWERPSDIFNTFGSADLLGRGANRVVFDVAGNGYRIVCKYVFGERQVHLFVCWIGTHAGYDVLCRKGEQYTVSIY